MKPAADATKPPTTAEARHARVVLLMSLGYLAAVSALMVSRGQFPFPDTLLLFGLGAALVAQRLGQFARDWVAPILLLAGYDYLRGLAPRLAVTAHTEPMITFDRALFGEVPSVSLQTLLFDPKQFHWWDYVTSFAYLTHFTLPMLTGFWFWMQDRALFRRYILTIVGVSYLAFFTYCLFPAVPPWMAAERGLIPAIVKLNSAVLESFARPFNIPTIYQFAGYNPVAAVPSLHAAYPLIVWFFTRLHKPWGWLLFPYPLVIWFAIVYSGDHYVFDIAAGAVYALPACWVTTRQRPLAQTTTSD